MEIWKEKYYELLNYQFKLLTRNKRTKEIIPLVFISPLFVIFLSIIDNHEHHFLLLLSFCSVYYIYFPLLFSWDSGCVRGIETKNIFIKDIILSKIIFSVVLNILSTIIVTPFIYFSDYYDIKEVLIFNLFNILFFPFIMTYLASFNNKKIDINQSRTLNLEGYSLVYVVFTILPLFVYIIIMILVSMLQIEPINIGVLLAFLSFLNLIYLKKWIRIILRNLEKKRYERLSNFKKDD